jgi:CRP-like cAMP-binding protein
MVAQDKIEAIKTIGLFDGLTDQELDEVTKICGETSFSEGQICQAEGQAAARIHLILKGKVGSVNPIRNALPPGSEMILEVFRAGDIFGWSSLIKGTTSWPAIRALEPVTALYIEARDLLNLCDQNDRIGNIIMRNLASIIASRLRRYRMSMLNTIVAIKGEW